MKRWYIFLILILLSTTSCKRRPPVETLMDSMPVFSKVYALKDYQSDSAMRFMQTIADTLDEAALLHQSPFLYHEYQVLKTEIRFKNFEYLRDDTLALEAFAFYDSVVKQSRGAERDERLFYQFTRSLYYKAAVEWHQGKKVESCSDYLRCLGAIDGLAGNRKAFRFGKCNTEYEHFTALVYDRLAEFFYNYDEWDEAFECLNLSNECFEKEGSPMGIASNYELMGDIILAQGDRISSLKYYRKADSIYESLEISNIRLYYSSLIHKALELYNRGKKEECNALLVSALPKDETDSQFARKIHFTLGSFYFAEQQYNSALYHFDRSYPLMSRQTLKSYSRAIMSANALGDSVKAAHYGQLLAELSMERFYRSGENTKMVTLFEQYKDEKDAVVGRSVFLYVVGFIVLLVLIIFIQIFWIHRRRKRIKADREQHEQVKTELEQQIAQTEAEARLKEEKISALEQELEKAAANPDFQKLPSDEKLDMLMKMPVCKRALKVLDYNVKAGVSYPELVMTENQFGQLINAVDAVFPKFSMKMIERYPRLKRSDIMYCCLYILGLNEIQAAALTGKTYQAVWKRSTKLQGIFDTKSNPQFVIKDIIKYWK